MHGPPLAAVNEEEAQNYDKVSDLIDPHNKRWKTDLIRRLFSQADAERVLHTRIVEMNSDKLVWTLTRNGKFSVKSAYNKLVEIKTNKQEIYDEEKANLYKEIWNMNTLPRVKHFYMESSQAMRDLPGKCSRLGNTVKPVSRIWKPLLIC